MFKEKVSQFINRGEKFVVELAAKFEVAAFIIKRWADGSTSPHPKIKDMITKWIDGKNK